MASGVSFGKQFSESPAEGANTKDAKMQDRDWLHSCAKLQLTQNSLHLVAFRFFLT